MSITPTTNIINQPDDQANMLLISQLYPDVYTQIISPQEAAKKPRRRRKKRKSGEGGGGGAKKRKLTEEQVTLLELNFGNEHKLESTEKKDRLASELGLDPRQVAVWFQNRRARWKNKKLEEEYFTLKKAHDNAVVEKCELESQMQKLKERLSEAEKEIQRMSERGGEGGGSTNSPSSSLSMEANFGGPPPYFGEFAVEDQYDDVLYMPQNNNYISAMELWMHPYM